MNNQNIDEALLYCDGSCAHRTRIAVGVLIKTPDGNEIEYSASISQHGSCNQSEYYAIITGLRLCLGNGTQKIHVYSDSQVVIRQLRGKYRINHGLRCLYDKTRNLEKHFTSVTYTWLPRETPEIMRVNRLAQLRNNLKIVH